MRNVHLLALPFAFLLAACGGSGSSSGSSGSGGSGGSDSSTSSSSSSSASSGAGGACTTNVTVPVDDSFKEVTLNKKIWTLKEPIGVFDVDSGDFVASQDDLSLGIQGTLQAGPDGEDYVFTTPLDATITFGCTDGVQYCRIDTNLFDLKGDGMGPVVTVQAQHDSAGNPTYLAFSLLDSSGIKNIETGITFSWNEASVLQITFDPASGALEARLTDAMAVEHVLQGTFVRSQYAFGVQLQGNSLDNGIISRLENISTNLDMMLTVPCPP